jgi:hypothetical protein
VLIEVFKLQVNIFLDFSGVSHAHWSSTVRLERLRVSNTSTLLSLIGQSLEALLSIINFELVFTLVVREAINVVDD